MTDRHSGYIVTLRDDIRSDDAEQILTALRMVSGVVNVKPLIGSWGDHVAAERRDELWREALIELVRNGPAKGARP